MVVSDRAAGLRVCCIREKGERVESGGGGDEGLAILLYCI